MFRCMGPSSWTLFLGISEPIKRLAALVQHTLFQRKWKKIHIYVGICVKEICKIFEIYWWTFFPTNYFLPLESCQLYIIANIKRATILKLKQSSRVVMGKRPVTLIKKRPWYRFCPVNITKSLRTIFW